MSYLKASVLVFLIGLGAAALGSFIWGFIMQIFGPQIPSVVLSMMIVIGLFTLVVFRVVDYWREDATK